MGGVLISGLCCSVLGAFFSVNAGRAAAVPGRILFMALRKSLYVLPESCLLYLDRGLPEIWQSISYYLLLASGIILAYVMASGIQKKRRKSVGMLEKSVRELGQNQRSVQESCKRAYPAGIFLLAAAVGIFVLSRKPERELRITCLDIGQGDRDCAGNSGRRSFSYGLRKQQQEKIQPSINFCLI